MTRYAKVIVAEDALLERLPAGAMARSQFESLMAESPGERSPADTHRDDMAFWLFSGGSTGFPKGVVHLHHDIEYTCETYAKEILRIQEDDVTFSSTKLYHAYGLGNNLTFPYWVGATTVLRPGRPDPQGLLETAAEQRPTLFFSVPTLYGAMVNLPDAFEHDLSSVRMCVSAAEPLAPEVLRRWQNCFGLDIVDGIGSTELLHIYCSNRPGRRPPGHERQAGARVRARPARRAARAGRRRRGGEPVGARRLRASPTTGTSTRRPRPPSTATCSSPAIATGSTSTATTSTRAAPTT